MIDHLCSVKEYKLDENTTYKTVYTIWTKPDADVRTTFESVKYDNKDGKSLIVEFKSEDEDEDLLSYTKYLLTISTLTPRRWFTKKVKETLYTTGTVATGNSSFEEYVLSSFDEKEHGSNVVKIIKKAQEDIAKARLIFSQEYKLNQAKEYKGYRQKKEEEAKQSKLKTKEAEKNALDQIIAQKAKDFNIR